MATLTTFAHDPILDLDAWIGQRQATFRFYRTDAVTHERLSEIHPLRGGDAPTLEHDTQRVIKRQLTIRLGMTDTALVNPISERIEPFMVFPGGVEYPLGRYMFSNPTLRQYVGADGTVRDLGTYVLTDEMFLVDQQIDHGIAGRSSGVPALVNQVLDGLNIQYTIEPTPYTSSDSWTVGTTRGQILDALCVSGSYFNPWFNNVGKLQFIRAFNASDRICDFDFDSGYKVMRGSVVHTDDLLSAPNTYIVTANASEGGTSAPIVGKATIAPTAPNSVKNRGFAIIDRKTLQVASTQQANAIAYGYVQRNSTLENVTLSTAPDPRHDGFNVIRWNNSNWLEIAWSLPLIEGGVMQHTLRKTYGV